MKHFILIIFTLVHVAVNAQGTININVTQDVKLAFLEDDHGNTPFTPDVRIDITLNGGRDSSVPVYGFLGTTLEIADLYGGKFYRYGLQGGVAFKSGITIPFTSILLHTSIEPYLGFGVIKRELTGSTLSYSGEMGFILAIELNDSFSLLSRQNLMQRGDLEIFKDEAASYNPFKWQPQWSIGIRYSI